FSVPTFWLAILLMIFFGLQLGWLPISGFRSINFDELTFLEKFTDITKHLVLPVFVSAFTGLAGLSRYTKSAMLEVLHQDYIRTARAKGLTESTVIFKHALRNALIPVVTIMGLTIPDLIGGSFIFETIFAWPGMGRLGYEAIMSRDYPVIMAVGTIVAILTLLGNLIADITYAYVDPRIRYK
ncbi:MAG: ABC transporter permease, partial [Elusimicrobiota bacterium]|nr:ABC transporter permease [Elusimicrobiota bacterium]